MTDQIKLIFLDAGEVLFHTRLPWDDRIRGILTARGYSRTQQDRAIAAGEAADQYSLGLSTWELERAHWQRCYAAICGALDGADLALADELMHTCHYVQNCVKFDDVDETLTLLQRRYRLAVISNAPPSIDWVFDRLDLKHYFEHITISTLVGAHKPDAGIYQSALASVGCQPTETFFVDDKLKNVQAGEAIGIRGIELRRGAQPGPGYLTTLAELPGYLEMRAKTG